MKKKTIAVIAGALVISIVCVNKFYIPWHERNVFEKARTSIETDIPDYANEILCSNDWVTSVNVTTDFKYQYSYNTYHDYTDTINYEIYLDSSFDTLDALEQYDILKELNQESQAVYNDLSNSDDSKYKAYNIKAYDYSLYNVTSIQHTDNVSFKTDSNTYKCSDSSEMYSKNDESIDISAIREELTFKNEYTELDSKSDWVGEWKNPSFSEITSTKVYSKDDNLYLCFFKGEKTIPFSIEKFPGSSNRIEHYNQYGDLVLQSKDELLFPAHNETYDINGVYKFVRVGSGISAPRELIVSKENRKDPAIGMTADEVKMSKWGEPGKINTTTTKYGTSEQWVYSQGYIYLENGIVTAIQN